MLKVDKASYKNIDVYYIRYVTIKKIDDCGSIYRGNPFSLRITYAKGYIGEKSGNKYLTFHSVDENKEVSKKYVDAWDGIKNKIKQ